LSVFLIPNTEETWRKLEWSEDGTFGDNSDGYAPVPVGGLSEAGALALTAEEGEVVVVQLVVDAVLNNVLHRRNTQEIRLQVVVHNCNIKPETGTCTEHL
jgi:hypothetical protein